MQKILITLTAYAGIVFLSGCAYDYWPYDGGQIGNFAWGYAPPYRYSYLDRPFSGNWYCGQHFNAIYCAHG